jgi:hypothetical protein
MTREKNTTHRSRRSSINQSINHSLARRSRTFSSSGAYVKSPVIADTASDVGNVLRTASRRQSPLGIEPRINESTNHIARITHHPSHRIASHPGMTCTTRARSPARPMVSANHRTARTLAGDASTPTIHARVDMSTTRSFSFFSLFFPSPLGRRGVARWMSPVIARRRFISLGRDDASNE